MNDTDRSASCPRPHTHGLPAFGQLVPYPLGRKAKRSAAMVVPRTFREQGLGKQIPDHKLVPSPFGSEAQQLSKDMDGDDDFVFLFQPMTISTLKMNLDARQLSGYKE
jgi:hypothetical protein